MKIFCAVACGVLLAMGAFAQGTEFTYQGRLTANGIAAAGIYDFEFRIAYDQAGTSFNPTPVITNGVTVTDGLFTVGVDFGAGIFTGSNYWLEISVRSNNVGDFVTLDSALQPLTPTPYAVFAGAAGNLSGTLPASQLSGTLPANVLAGAYSNAVALTNPGNAFYGNGGGLTNLDGWQLKGNSGTSPASGNFLGTADNQPLEVKVNGLRAMRYEFGGVSSAAMGQGFTVPNGAPNVIGGAPGNFVPAGVVGVVIAGGGATNYGPFVFANTVAADFGVVGGGVGNRILAGTDSRCSTIAGGESNSITGAGSFIGGGGFNGLHVYGNTIQANDAVISGGMSNRIIFDYCVIGGGFNNLIQGEWATIAGGAGNRITEPYSTIAGGANNVVSGVGSSIGGGGVDGGGNSLPNTNGADYSVIGGGIGNQIQSSAPGSFVGGGQMNVIQSGAVNGTIGGGLGNILFSSGGFIGGGNHNTNFGLTAVVGGGTQNQIRSGTYSTIAGGLDNLVQLNVNGAVIGGGISNSVIGNFGIIPGGYLNVAGTNSFAAGHRAKATNSGAFVWADATEADFADAGTNTFNVRASGGATFAMASGGSTQTLVWAPGSGGWSFTSDRNAKEHFAPVDSREVLEKVASLPLTEWSYKGFSERHLGPMAQDFHAAFPFNPNDKMLNSADEAGVSLAAIQGLNQKLESELNEKNSRILELERRLEILETKFQTMSEAREFKP